MPVLDAKTLHWTAALGLAALLSLSPALDAEIYKVVDEQGRVTFTDSPPPGSKAEKIELREQSNRLPPPPASPPKEEAPEVDPIPDYRVVINYPPQDFHVTPGIRNLDVQISVDPALQEGHRVELTDNGAVVPGLQLQNMVVRGTHVLLARVLDEKGNILSASEPVQIHVHRPSIGGRQNQSRK